MSVFSLLLWSAQSSLLTPIYNSLTSLGLWHPSVKSTIIWCTQPMKEALSSLHTIEMRLPVLNTRVPKLHSQTSNSRSENMCTIYFTRNYWSTFQSICMNSNPSSNVWVSLSVHSFTCCIYHGSSTHMTLSSSQKNHDFRSDSLGLQG